VIALRSGTAPRDRWESQGVTSLPPPSHRRLFPGSIWRICPARRYRSHCEARGPGTRKLGPSRATGWEARVSVGPDLVVAVGAGNAVGARTHMRVPGNRCLVGVGSAVSCEVSHVRSGESPQGIFRDSQCGLCAVDHRRGIATKAPFAESRDNGCHSVIRGAQVDGVMPAEGA
jgi:hypothetical protein